MLFIAHQESEYLVKYYVFSYPVYIKGQDTRTSVHNNNLLTPTGHVMHQHV
jgi:hypothetical protein